MGVGAGMRPPVIVRKQREKGMVRSGIGTLCRVPDRPSACLFGILANMTRAKGKRDHGRLLKLLALRLAEPIPVEVVPLAAIPAPILKNAVLIRARRPKGVPKVRR
jgi:hypothetical protein